MESHIPHAERLEMMRETVRNKQVYRPTLQVQPTFERIKAFPSRTIEAVPCAKGGLLAVDEVHPPADDFPSMPIG